MNAPAWIRKLFGVSAARTTRKASARVRPPRRQRPSVEILESRFAPATLQVNSLLDSTNPGSGLVTLRQAVIASETHKTTALGQTGTGNDTITFASALAGQTITLTQADSNLAFGPTGLVITDTIEIDGPAGGITISGNNTERVFGVASGATLTLQDLTVTGGNAQGGAGGNVTSGTGSGGGGGAGLGGAV
jgi:hypothetical protein